MGESGGALFVVVPPVGIEHAASVGRVVTDSNELSTYGLDMRTGGKRSDCTICSTEFPARGSKQTCSEPCRIEYRERRREIFMSTHPPARRLCRNPERPEFILDRISIDQATGCWEWTKSRNPQTGYGQIGMPPYTAHRLSFMLFHGTPTAPVIRHLCHNKGCCNPDHITEGDYQDNYNDSRAVHMAASVRMRGRDAHNRMPVAVNGITYASQVEAMSQLHVTYKTLLKMAE